MLFINLDLKGISTVSGAVLFDGWYASEQVKLIAAVVILSVFEIVYKKWLARVCAGEFQPLFVGSDFKV